MLVTRTILVLFGFHCIDKKQTLRHFSKKKKINKKIVLHRKKQTRTGLELHFWVNYPFNIRQKAIKISGHNLTQPFDKQIHYFVDASSDTESTRSKSQSLHYWNHRNPI